MEDKRHIETFVFVITPQRVVTFAQNFVTRHKIRPK